MYSPTMTSSWVDCPLNGEQYSKLKIKWRRRQNRYDIQNPPRDLRVRPFCTFGGDDYKIISLEVRGDIDAYAMTTGVMKDWIVENLGEF